MNNARAHAMRVSLVAMIGAALLLVTAMVAATGHGSASVPAVPTDMTKTSAYLAAHGERLTTEFARAQLGARHPGGATAVRSDTVQATAKQLFARLQTKSIEQQWQSMRGMHAAVYSATATASTQ